jgi:transcriptional regulator with XRE-family HTH domain
LLAGSGGAMAGGALLGAQLAEEERQRAEERISTDIMSADLQRKRQQEEEIRALQAAEGQRQAEAQAAAGAIIGAGVEAGVTTGAQERLFAGARSPSTQTVQALSQSLGVSPDEARGYIELSITNPEVFKYLTAVQGGKMGGQ